MVRTTPFFSTLHVCHREWHLALGVAETGYVRPNKGGIGTLIWREADYGEICIASTIEQALLDMRNEIESIQ